jgi:RNA 2',3'-cyclic 3'-phosphodiesterase
MYRLFIAIDVPDGLKEKATAMCNGVASARWVPASQLHLTLRFIGDADEALFREIAGSLDLVDSPVFDLTFRGTGCFPGPRRPRVLWIGMEESQPLLSLQRRIEEAVVAAGVVPEERPFSPHLTLARLKEPSRGDVERFLRQNESFAAPPFAVREFHLYSSRLSPKGAIHTRERTYPLLETGEGTCGG